MKTIFTSYRKYLLGILLLSLISAGVFAQTITYTVQPDPTAGKDAYINHKDASDTYGNNNCGTCTTIPGLRWTSGGIWFNGRSLMQFDLSSIPTNAIVTSAKLYLYGTGHSDLGGHGDSCNLFRITASWDESTVTYNNQPSHGTTFVQLPASTSANQNYTVTVTSDVQNMVSSPSTNYGWIMISCAETHSYYEELQFFSSDYTTDATKRPKIEVTYCQQPTAGSNTPVCSGNTLSLTSSTITSATYSWAGPNGFTSSSQNPTITNVTTAASGTYTVTTTVGGTACTTHGTTSVTINQTPSAPTAGSPSAWCSGNTLSLTASTITGATYAWTGPNSFTSSLQNPTIASITTAGTGTYSVTATVSGCTGAAGTIAVTITQTPSAPTAGSNTPVCSGSTLSLTASSTGSTYSWTGPNSFTSASQNPTIGSITTLATGTYYVTATTSGCTGSTGSTAVTINQTPSAPTAGSNSWLCSGNTLSLTASSTGSTYSWHGPNSYTSASQNPTITNVTTAASGTYSVTATTSGCTGSAGTTVVIIYQTPSAPTAGSNTPVCSGNTLSLTASTIASASYTWSGPNSFTSSSQNPTISSVTTLATGMYSVTATTHSALGQCTSAAGTTSVTINQTPSAPTAGSNTPVCSGNTLSLTASTIAGATYAWTGPNSYTSASQNPTITNVTTAGTGTYSVTATVSGCTGSNGTTAVTVNALPTPTVTASPSFTICNGQSTTITASGGTSYSWNTGATTSALSVSLTTTTSYTVTVTNSNGCIATASNTVIVNSNPTPSVSGVSTVCAGQNATLTASGGSTYSWNTGATTTAITIAPTATTIYTVTATNSSGCTATASRSIIIPIDLGSADTCTGNITMSDSVMWFKVVADSSVMQFTTYPSSNTSDTSYAHLKSLAVYSGSCNSLALIGIRQTNNDTLPGLQLWGLTTGNTYFIKIVKTNPLAIFRICIQKPLPQLSSSCSFTTCGNNLVANGGFESGNTGFTSGQAAIWVTSNATSLNSNWCGTSHSGNNFMICDIWMATIPNPTIWEKNINVCPNTQYVFSAWLHNVDRCVGNSFPRIQLTINSAPVTSSPIYAMRECPGGTGSCAAGNCTPCNVWTQICLPWTSSTTTADLKVNASWVNYGAPGEDIAIDDIEFYEISPNAPITATSSTICVGQSTTLTVSGGSTYSWSTGATTSSITVSPSVTTNYSVTVIGCTCSTTITTTVTVNSLPTANAGADQTICSGQNATLTASGGVVYYWNTSATTSVIAVNPTTTTSYSVEVVNSNGCTAIASVTVTVNPTPTVTIGGTNTICSGQSTTLTAGGGVVYYWNTGATDAAITVSPSSTTSYSVEVVNSSGCTAIASATVTVNPTPTVTIGGTNTICSGQSTTLTAGGGVVYYWNTGATDAAITVSPTTTTSYSVEVVNSSGCTAIASATVTVNPTPTITIGGVSTLCPALSTTTLTASGGTTYSWSTGQTTTSITVSPTTATQYYVIGTDANGCSSADLTYLTGNTDCPDFLYEDCFVWLDNDVFNTYSMTKFSIGVIEHGPPISGPCTGTVTANVLTGNSLVPEFVTSISTHLYNYHNLSLPSGHTVLELTTENILLNQVSWLFPPATNTDYTFQLYDMSTGTPVQIGTDDCITTPSIHCDAVVTRTISNDTSSSEKSETGEVLFYIFPNPASNNVTLSYSLPKNQTGIFELYDVYGKLCVKDVLSADTKNKEINISLLSNGIYYCRLGYEENMTKVKKLVIAK